MGAKKNNNSNNNKARRKHDVKPVLLGVPDGRVEYDTDAYVTKLGGVPIWLQADAPPSKSVCTCKNCGQLQYLIFQGYVPLPESIYHRVLYVWACNRRECMRKPTSFTVVRSHLVDPEYLKAQKQKQEAARRKKAAAAKAQQQAKAQPFQLGDLWGAGPSSFNSNQANPFGNPFAQQTTPQPAPPSSPPVQTEQEQEQEEDDEALTAQMSALTIVQDPVDVAALPRFPAEYLYIAEENLQRYETLGFSAKRYQEFVDLQEMLLSEEADGEWKGEMYEKQAMPGGVDKQFTQFLERVECEPSQCVRYAWAGTPLFYGQLQQQQQPPLGGHCSHCGSRRVFEMQLMPTVLSVLNVEAYAHVEKEAESPAQWNVGMEFGTVLIFVCERDCHPAPTEQVSYSEECCIVQYEEM